MKLPRNFPATKPLQFACSLCSSLFGYFIFSTSTMAGCNLDPPCLLSKLSDLSRIDKSFQFACCSPADPGKDQLHTVQSQPGRDRTILNFRKLLLFCKSLFHGFQLQTIIWREAKDGVWECVRRLCLAEILK
ncbi:hypothetical protein NE237_014784 [Protea cynaroides]|uniref:Uncharacterized protein n=1 Tax=Protea cynaroides TaxID=273540 RepID=A0A9Q0QQG5_9MAGN|nr:hypothetical protein NE237_014784 [Protea cynaroides]